MLEVLPGASPSLFFRLSLIPETVLDKAPADSVTPNREGKHGGTSMSLKWHVLGYNCIL